MRSVGAVSGVERQEGLLAVGADPVADDARDLVDLEVHRLGPVRDDVILEGPIRDLNAIGPLRKEVDDRRAEQREIGAVDDALERALALAQEHHQLDLVGVGEAHRRLETCHLEKTEALRKCKILLQQPVALERTERHRQERLVVGEANRPDTRGRSELMPARALGRQDEDTQRAAENKFEQLVRHVVMPRQIKTERIE